MTETINSKSALVQWQDEGEGAILIEPYSSSIVLTQHEDHIHIELASINEFVKNIRLAQKKANEKKS